METVKMTPEEMTKYISNKRAQYREASKNYYKKNWKLNEEMTEEQKQKVISKKEAKKAYLKAYYQRNKAKKQENMISV